MFSNSHFQFQTQVKRAADGAGREVVLANPGLVEARWQDTHTHHYADDANYADDDVDDDADDADDDGDGDGDGDGDDVADDVMI